MWKRPHGGVQRLPNLQTVRIKEGGTVKKATVCTRCIRTGNFEKAV
jgi:ribosomal protein L28